LNKTKISHSTKNTKSDVKYRAFQRLLHSNKVLINEECCHSIQQDLQHVILSPRQEKGVPTFPGISNYIKLQKADQIKVD
jgi:hypothetical protein